MEGYVVVGLKRGTVELIPHQKEWSENAENVIRLLKQLLGDTAVVFSILEVQLFPQSTQSQLLILLLP